MKKFKQLIEENITGVLGTIIFHLVLLNVFFFIQLSSLKSEKHIEFEIAFEELDEDELLPKDEKKEFIEQELNNFSTEMHSNIAVNEANKNLAEEINSEDYEKQVMDELNMDELFPDNEPDFEIPVNDEKEKEETKPEEQKEYSGPTNITYFLENRTKRYLHIPVYQCQGGGTVKLNIVVDQRGFVVSATVDAAGSNANSECLNLAALNAARRSRFNTDYNSPNRQKGTITYQFVAQ